MLMLLSHPLQSFKVDSLTRRWAAFLLLLLVWGVSFCFFLKPPGDPDFSQLLFWYEDMQEAADPYAFMMQNPFDTVFTWQNVIYIGAFFLYMFFLYLSGLFYFVMYICDKREVAFKRVPYVFFSRVGWIVLLTGVTFFPALLMFSVLPYVFLVLIPALYALPGLVFFEKKNSFSAIAGSINVTRGMKFSIFFELSVIVLIFMLINGVLSWILNTDSVGYFMVYGFVMSYFTLVVARNMGIRYHMITMLSKE